VDRRLRVTLPDPLVGVLERIAEDAGEPVARVAARLAMVEVEDSNPFIRLDQRPCFRDGAACGVDAARSRSGSGDGGSLASVSSLVDRTCCDLA
jgi:hypothetical protein